MQEKNFLRDYEGFRFFDAGKYTNGDMMIDIFVIVNGKEVGESVYTIYFQNQHPGDLNKGVERAKEWVNKLRKCRICKCNEFNCGQCIEKTGKACHWVEDDLCSACAPEKEIIVTDSRHTNKESLNDNSNMNFFQRLVAIGNIDITMRIMQKGDTLTMNIMPGSNKSTNKPFNITGTGPELDVEFFKTIFPGVQEIKGIVHNLEEVKKDVEEKKEKKSSAPAKSSAQKKSASAKKAIPKTAPKKKTDKKSTPVKKTAKKAEKNAEKVKKKDAKVKKETPVPVEASLFDAPAEEIQEQQVEVQPEVVSEESQS